MINPVEVPSMKWLSHLQQRNLILKGAINKDKRVIKNKFLYFQNTIALAYKTHIIPILTIMEYCSHFRNLSNEIQFFSSCSQNRAKV